jgi:hypothetical protein
MEDSPDGEKWTRLDILPLAGMPRRVKVGVVAESAPAESSFDVVFDMFELSLLK